MKNEEGEERKNFPNTKMENIYRQLNIFLPFSNSFRFIVFAFIQDFSISFNLKYLKCDFGV